MHLHELTFQVLLQVYQAYAHFPDKGCFYPPTLITNVQTVSNVVVEEVDIPCML